MFFKNWRNKYRSWKLFQSYTKLDRDRGYWPSETYVKYPPTCTFDGKKVLNLGCGTSVYHAPNVTNLDGFKGEGVDIVWDLSKTPLPFEDQEFDFIIANHVIEHIPNWFECFKELARITKIGGVIEVWCPPVSSDTAFTYRDHINSIGLQSFWGCNNYGNPGCNLWAKTEGKDALGHIKNLDIIGTSDRPACFLWALFIPDSLLMWMTKHLRNLVSETSYVFRKVRHE